MEFTRSTLCAAVLASAAFGFSNPLAAQEQRIVGGAPILLDEAPSIVAIIRNTVFNVTGSFFLSQFCAGTLVSESFVVTAAHCVVDDDVVSDPSELSVLGNTFDLNNPGGDALSVVDITVHESYRSASNSFDIAILTLSAPVNLPTAELIDPAFLLELNEPVTIAGWGTRQFNEVTGVSSDSPVALEGAEVLAVPPEICNALPTMAGGVDETMVCAGIPTGGIDACQGDSGGPLYRQTEDGEFILAGITSWGIGCALENFPGVYTNIAFFNDWINDRIIEPLVTPAPPVVIEPEPPVITPDPDPPVVVTPDPDTPVVVTPDPDTPVDVTPDADTPVDVTPDPDTPVVVTPDADTPVDVTPDPDTPVVVTPDADTPVVVTPDPDPPVVVSPEFETDDPLAIDNIDTTDALPVASSGGGGGSAGGILLGVLAFAGAIRRRLIKV